eukprot:tig00000042_g15639.t1
MSNGICACCLQGTYELPFSESGKIRASGSEEVRAMHMLAWAAGRSDLNVHVHIRVDARGRAQYHGSGIYTAPATETQNFTYTDEFVEKRTFDVTDSYTETGGYVLRQIVTPQKVYYGEFTKLPNLAYAQSPAPDALQWTRDPSSETFAGTSFPQESARLPDGPRVPVEGVQGQWTPIAPPQVTTGSATISYEAPQQSCGGSFCLKSQLPAIATEKGTEMKAPGALDADFAAGLQLNETLLRALELNVGTYEIYARDNRTGMEVVKGTLAESVDPNQEYWAGRAFPSGEPTIALSAEPTGERVRLCTPAPICILLRIPTTETRDESGDSNLEPNLTVAGEPKLTAEFKTPIPGPQSCTTDECLAVEGPASNAADLLTSSCPGDSASCELATSLKCPLAGPALGPLIPEERAPGMVYCDDFLGRFTAQNVTIQELPPQAKLGLLLTSSENAARYTFSGTEELWSSVFAEKSEVPMSEVGAALEPFQEPFGGVERALEGAFRYDALGDRDRNLDKSELLACREPITEAAYFARQTGPELGPMISSGPEDVDGIEPDFGGFITSVPGDGTGPELGSMISSGPEPEEGIKTIYCDDLAKQLETDPSLQSLSAWEKLSMVLESADNDAKFVFAGTEAIWGETFGEQEEVSSDELFAMVQYAKLSQKAFDMFGLYDNHGDGDANLDKSEFLHCGSPMQVPASRLAQDILTVQPEEASEAELELEVELAEDAAAEDAAAAAAELAAADE